MQSFYIRRLAAEYLTGKGIPTSEQTLADIASRRSDGPI